MQTEATTPGNGLRLLRNALGASGTPSNRSWQVQQTITGHGPMTFDELVDWTGLGREEVHDALQSLQADGKVSQNRITRAWSGSARVHAADVQGEGRPQTAKNIAVLCGVIAGVLIILALGLLAG